MSLREFQTRFGSDKQCRRALFVACWPYGSVTFPARAQSTAVSSSKPYLLKEQYQALLLKFAKFSRAVVLDDQQENEALGLLLSFGKKAFTKQA